MPVSIINADEDEEVMLLKILYDSGETQSSALGWHEANVHADK